MTPVDIAWLRLHNQQIAHSTFPYGSSGRTPGKLVAHLGAVQAQDFDGAMWAVGLRQGVRRSRSCHVRARLAG